MVIDKVLVGIYIIASVFAGLSEVFMLNRSYRNLFMRVQLISFTVMCCFYVFCMFLIQLNSLLVFVQTVNIVLMSIVLITKVIIWKLCNKTLSNFFLKNKFNLFTFIIFLAHISLALLRFFVAVAIDGALNPPNH